MSSNRVTRTSTSTSRPEGAGALPSTRGLWALGFVAAALVALVAVPIYFGRRADVLQAKITNVVEPSARYSSNLLLLKARQMARMEGYLQTGDRSFRDPYQATLAAEDSIFAQLRVLSTELHLEVFESVAGLQTESINWRFTNQRIFDLGVDEDARSRVQAGFDDLQRATRELDRAIQAEVVAGRRDMANERRLEARITLALAIVALFATVIVGRIAYRYRDLLIERETRRRDAVRARREIDALLEATGDGVLGVDLEGVCISLNRAGAKLLGYTAGEIAGRDVHATILHSTADGTPVPREGSPLLTAVSEGRALHSADDAVLWHRKRRSFPAHWSLQPLIDGTDLRGAVLTFTDMTEIHEKEEALHRAVRQREDVVSIVSHDLRNPLGVALAAADLLLDLPLDEQQRRRQAEIIRRSGKRMQNLIEDLLDVSRIEAGAFVVRPSQEELVPILEEARDIFQGQADARSISLEVSAPEGETRARVDRDRVMQALSNLLENAIRLTPEGGAVRLTTRGDGDDALLTVADTGPGIAPDLLERLFDRFAQADEGGRGAAGLGLTIVRGVAASHGGEVSVTSEQGVGTSFCLRLPKAGPGSSDEARAAV